MLYTAAAGAGVAPVSWGYDTLLDAMVADLDRGLTGMQGAKILALTSTFAPFVNDVFGDVFDPSQSLNVMVPVVDLGDTLQESFRWNGITAQQQLFFYQRLVPEPSTLLLLVACGAAFGISRRRDLKRAANYKFTR